MKFCKYCGYKEDDDLALFCEKCGKAFSVKKETKGDINQGKDEIQENNSQVEISKQLLEEISLGVINFSPTDLQLSNLRSKCKIPSTETILGIIDCTVFGSAKNGIAFTSQRIYHKTDFEDPFCIKIKALSYYYFESGFMCVKLKLDSATIYEFNISGAKINSGQLIGLLTRLKELYSNLESLVNVKNTTDKEDCHTKNINSEDRRIENQSTSSYEISLKDLLSQSVLDKFFHFKDLEQRIKRFREDEPDDDDDNYFVNFTIDTFTLSAISFENNKENCRIKNFGKDFLLDPFGYFLVCLLLIKNIELWNKQIQERRMLNEENKEQISRAVSSILNNNILRPIMLELKSNNLAPWETKEEMDAFLSEINSSNLHGPVVDNIVKYGVQIFHNNDQEFFKDEAYSYVFYFLNREEEYWKSYLTQLIDAFLS